MTLHNSSHPSSFRPLEDAHASHATLYFCELLLSASASAHRCGASLMSSSLAFSPLRICGRDRRGKRRARKAPLCHVLCSLTSHVAHEGREVTQYHITLGERASDFDLYTVQAHSIAALRSLHGTSPSFLPSFAPSFVDVQSD